MPARSAATRRGSELASRRDTAKGLGMNKLLCPKCEGWLVYHTGLIGERYYPHRICIKCGRRYDEPPDPASTPAGDSGAVEEEPK